MYFLCRPIFLFLFLFFSFYFYFFSFGVYSVQCATVHRAVCSKRNGIVIVDIMLTRSLAENSKLCKTQPLLNRMHIHLHWLRLPYAVRVYVCAMRCKCIYKVFVWLCAHTHTHFVSSFLKQKKSSSHSLSSVAEQFLYSIHTIDMNNIERETCFKKTLTQQASHSRISNWKYTKNVNARLCEFSVSHYLQPQLYTNTNAIRVRWLTLYKCNKMHSIGSAAQQRNEFSRIEEQNKTKQ